MNRLEIATHILAGLLANPNFGRPDPTMDASMALKEADALIAAAGKPAADLATRIADDLMTCGSGEKADRLDMVAHNQCSLGGWSREALIQRISKHLKP